MTHTETHYGHTATLHYGVHVLDALRGLPDGSVQCIVTSPPYWGLRNYKTDPIAWPDGWLGELGQEPTPELFVAHLVLIFRECRRVLRNDGVLWLNLGDSYCGSNSAGIEDNKAAGRGTHRTTVEHKPNKKVDGLKPKDLVMIPAQTALALRADGWYLRAENVWAKPNPMPESVEDRTTRSHEMVYLLTKSRDYFYDHEAVAEDIAQSTITRVQLANSRKDVATDFKDSSEYKRVDTARVSVDKFADGRDHLVCVPNGNKRNLRSVWWIATQPYSGSHYATFPESLPELCIKAGSSESCCGACGTPYKRKTDVIGHQVTDAMRVAGCDSNGNYNGTAQKDYGSAKAQDPSSTKARILEKMSQIVQHSWTPGCTCNTEPARCTVLDPFMGSGTTAAVALRLNRNVIGIDLDPTNLSLARERIRKSVARNERTLSIL